MNVKPQRVPSSPKTVPAHDLLVCVDSDGCVFDSMDPKQRRCFHPQIISQWGLERIAACVRETACFVNLYSRYRGGNRFPSLVLTFDLLRRHPQAVASGAFIPRLDTLRKLIEECPAMDQSVVETAARATGDPDLAAVLDWSRCVNRCIELLGDDIKPFPGVREALGAMGERADLVVVSQTPADALAREWRRHGLEGCVSGIGGQEAGTKTRQIEAAMRAGGFEPARVLVIGDAVGDLDAARATGVEFFPIVPGDEAASWRRLRDEVWPPFAAGQGGVERSLVGDFLTRLPERPPWESGSARGEVGAG